MTADRPASTAVVLSRSWLPIAGAAIAAIGLVLAFGWMVDNARPRKVPPVLSTVTSELTAIERSGHEVKLSSLRGKVTVIAHVYTVCPHGCMAVLGEMTKLLREFGGRDDFHLVSVAVIPSHDSPEFLRSFATGMRIADDAPWWFLTGEEKQLWSFMTDGLGLSKPEPIPEPERLNPLDLFTHDLRIVLLDRRQRVRGYYDVAHPQPEIGGLMRHRLRSDTGFLLKNPGL